MADTDAARIGDVKAGLGAAKLDANTRLKRDGSNVDMTPDEAASFRAAIGAGGGGGGSGDVVGPATSVANHLAQFADTTGKLLKNGPSIGVSSADSIPTRADGDGRWLLATLLATANGVASLGADAKVPTSQLPDAVLGALKWQGAWNASTNSPAIPAAASGNKGWYFVVNVAGTTSVSGIADWEIGDWLVSNGTAWEKIDNTDQVVSVAGLRGIVTAAALKSALAIAIADVVGLQGALDAKAGLLDTIVTVTGTTYTLQASDNGKVVEFGNAAAITLTIPVLTAGFNCLVRQTAAGVPTFTASGTTLRNRQSHTKLAGQWAEASISYRTTTEVVISGDTAA